MQNGKIQSILRFNPIIAEERISLWSQAGFADRMLTGQTWKSKNRFLVDEESTHKWHRIMSAYQSGWASQNVSKFMPSPPQEMKWAIVEDELMALSDKAWWKPAHAYCLTMFRSDLQSQASLWDLDTHSGKSAARWVCQAPYNSTSPEEKLMGGFQPMTSASRPWICEAAQKQIEWQENTVLNFISKSHIVMSWDTLDRSLLLFSTQSNPACNEYSKFWEVCRRLTVQKLQTIAFCFDRELSFLAFSVEVPSLHIHCSYLPSYNGIETVTANSSQSQCIPESNVS